MTSFAFDGLSVLLECKDESRNSKWETDLFRDRGIHTVFWDTGGEERASSPKSYDVFLDIFCH